MRIVVVGAGALGGLFGAQLHEAGQDVTLLEANVARAKLLSEEGLFLSEAEKGERQVRPRRRHLAGRAAASGPASSWR